MSEDLNNAVAEANGENRRTCSFNIVVSWDEKGVRHEPPTTNDFEFDASIPAPVKMMVADLMVQAAGIIFQLAERQDQGRSQTKSGLEVPTRGRMRLN